MHFTDFAMKQLLYMHKSKTRYITDFYTKCVEVLHGFKRVTVSADICKMYRVRVYPLVRI